MTATFRLRSWLESDASWYIGSRDDEILRWTTEPDELTVNEFVTGLADLDGIDRAGFAVVDAEGGLVGNVAAVRRGPDAEVSYWVAAPARGRGAAKFALEAMTAWVADNWPVSRVELLITPDNSASVAVAGRCGYTFTEKRKSCLSCAGPDGTVVVYAKDLAGPVS